MAPGNVLEVRDDLLDQRIAHPLAFALQARIGTEVAGCIALSERFEVNVSGELEIGRVPTRQDIQVVAHQLWCQGLHRPAVDAEALGQTVDGRAGKSELPSLLENATRVIRLVVLDQGIDVAEPVLRLLRVAVEGDFQESLGFVRLAVSADQHAEIVIGIGMPRLRLQYRPVEAFGVLQLARLVCFNRLLQGLVDAQFQERFLPTDAALGKFRESL